MGWWGYGVRLVWNLPVTPETYQELGFPVHQPVMTVRAMTLELADSEGIVFEVEPLPGLEDEWLGLLEEPASKARRVRVIVERDGVPVLTSAYYARAHLCPEYLEAGGGER